MAFHVPTCNMPIVDLTCCNQEKAAKHNDLMPSITKKVVKQASKGSLKGILPYTEGQVISCDFNNDAYSSTFDAGAGAALNDNVVKLISWNNSEYGYSSRVDDLTAYIASKE
ncbi:Glyceraldehyde-3-phosphate dehydrogenase [Lemmus lemmus]